MSDPCQRRHTFPPFRSRCHPPLRVLALGAIPPMAQKRDSNAEPVVLVRAGNVVGVTGGPAGRRLLGGVWHRCRAVMRAAVKCGPDRENTGIPVVYCKSGRRFVRSWGRIVMGASTSEAYHRFHSSYCHLLHRPPTATTSSVVSLLPTVLNSSF